MVDIEAKAALLRRRVEALSFPDEAMVEASAVIAAAGMRLPGAAKQLRKEWLNDIVASPDGAVFRSARRDPGAHFIAWAKERAADRYRVTWRAVDQVARRLGPEAASRIARIVWPQEIAWAQRLRMSDNPHVATRAAMFLREAEGNPARLFGEISDLYGEAVMRSDYSDSPAHELSPSEIRSSASVPEFNPLFLRYAARAYTDIMHAMTRDKLEALAVRARRDETQEKARMASQAAVAAARRFPMRRILTVISTAAAHGLSPNALYLVEEAFLVRAGNGDVEIDPRSRTPQAEFVAALADPVERTRLLADAPQPQFDEVAAMWEIANLDRRWLDGLPESFRRWSPGWFASMEAWKAGVVTETRATPFDPVSDFGFYLLEGDS